MLESRRRLLNTSLLVVLVRGDLHCRNGHDARCRLMGRLMSTPL
jgi:hypothetical protein